MFTWIPIHKETASKLLSLSDAQREMLSTLREMNDRGLTVISLQDQDTNGTAIPLSEIDPFTFFASFNRGISADKRTANWRFLQERWELKSAVPDDFDGIPVVHNMVSKFFPYSPERSPDHIASLWQVAGQGIRGGPSAIDPALFDRCVTLPVVSTATLTMGLFWLNPEQFVPADRKTVAYGQANGVAAGPNSFQTYVEWVAQISAVLGSDYAKISHSAHLFATQDDHELDLDEARMAILWNDFMVSTLTLRTSRFLARGSSNRRPGTNAQSSRPSTANSGDDNSNG